MSQRSDKLRNERKIKRLERQQRELEEKLRQNQRDQEEDRKRVDGLLTRLWSESGMKGTPEKASDFEWALVFWTEYKRAEYSEVIREFVERKMTPYSFLFSESREEFGRTWRESSYARLSLGHKVGAALALTAAPEDEVKAPWGAWSMQVPDHLLPIDGDDERKAIEDIDGSVKQGAKDALDEALRIRAPGLEDRRQVILDMLDELPPPAADIQRVFCLGSEPAFALARTEASKKFVILSHSGRERPPVWWELLRNLVKGACLVLDGRPPGEGGKWSSPTKGRRGPPDGAQYELGKEVAIDLRQELRRVLRGSREGASPSVQFLVRGHWRNQAHGEGRSLRRRQWIEPFWKGPEEARVLLRGHEVKG